MSNTQITPHRLCTTLQILKTNPVESGIAQGTQEPYEWHTAECILLDEAGDATGVGRLVFPRELREKLGGVPPIGIYQVVISLVRLTGKRSGEIGTQIIDLVPIAF